MKNTTIFCIFGLSFFLLTSFSLSNNKDYDHVESSRVVGNFFFRIKSLFAEKYNVKPIGTIISMPGGELSLLGLDFNICGPITKDEARSLLISMSEDFMNEFRSDQKLLSYMPDPNITVHNINIGLYIYDKYGYSTKDPDLSVATVHDGHLKFSVLGENECLPYKSREMETFEEAKRIVESNKNDK